ncbi:hypothetical protein HPB49_007549 [Dermacentor silvarum]|uniref:Uncharacterized protein n=1 Tax=Dermacentor silvarum TaxID=543639 RepID=A0ACB8C808_DERSI|nr:hypothetical protein HPB49_007549 [Dermacentor silvarum]
MSPGHAFLKDPFLFNLSPFLFNLALASLPSAIPADLRHRVCISVYADDVALWTRGPTRSLPAVRSCLQRALDEIVSYFQAVGLSHGLTPSSSTDGAGRQSQTMEAGRGLLVPAPALVG